MQQFIKNFKSLLTSVRASKSIYFIDFSQYFRVISLYTHSYKYQQFYAYEVWVHNTLHTLRRCGWECENNCNCFVATAKTLKLRHLAHSHIHQNIDTHIHIPLSHTTKLTSTIPINKKAINIHSNCHSIHAGAEQYSIKWNTKAIQRKTKNEKKKLEICQLSKCRNHTIANNQTQSATQNYYSYTIYIFLL